MRFFLHLFCFFAFCAVARAANVELHYAPAENLEAIDIRLINTARHSIDMAAYVLCDERVVAALESAADRGVRVRIYLDRGEYEHGDYERDNMTAKLGRLLSHRNVRLRVKSSAVLMHLKAYAVDNFVLRTGSSNFSFSGLLRQDNDLLLTDDKGAIGRFEREFATIFSQGITPQTWADKD